MVATPHAPFVGMVPTTVSANALCTRIPVENKNIEAKTSGSQRLVPLLLFSRFTYSYRVNTYLNIVKLFYKINTDYLSIA